MNIIDTLKCDTAMISQIRESGKYDYYKQKIQEADNNFELPELSYNGSNSKVMMVVAIVLLVLIITFIIFMMYRNGVFSRNKKTPPNEDEENTEDTNIQGIDFEKELNSALNKGNWNEAVRMIYLHSLFLLNEKGVVAWMPYKTPTEYSYEANDVNFTWMTNVFLNTRYGMFDADELAVREMQKRQQKMKGGEYEE